MAMTTPTLTPAEKALQRVLTISRLNGWSVTVIASLGSLLALVLGDLTSLFIGGCVVVAGIMEVRGNRQLQRRDPDGMKGLIRSQLFLLAVMLVYCVGRLGSFDADTAMASLTPDMEAVLKEAGLERADILPLVRMTFLGTYLAIAATCLIYQGGLALYYRSKVRLVTEALTTPPAVTY